MVCVVLVFHIIGWTDFPPLRCGGRPPPGRRDSPGPGGRHRGQDHGEQDTATTMTDHFDPAILFTT